LKASLVKPVISKKKDSPKTTEVSVETKSVENKKKGLFGLF
jgi:hypothetical protein